jgi:hypothetical protein
MEVYVPGCHPQNIIWTEAEARSAMNYLLYYTQYLQICQTCFCYFIFKTKLDVSECPRHEY